MSANEARDRVQRGLHFMRHAMNEAAKEGRAQVGILFVRPDGTGQLVARFDAPSFFEDIAEALELGPLTDEQLEDAEDLRAWDRAKAKVLGGGT